MKHLFNDLIHGKLAFAFFLILALLATASVPLIGTSFVEPALLFPPPGMLSVIVMTDTTCTAARAAIAVGGQVTDELTLIDHLVATSNGAQPVYDICHLTADLEII